MMLSESHRILVRNYGTLLGRMLIGLLFFYTGLMMALNGTEQIAGMIGGYGFPAAMALTWFLVAVKMLGGVSLMLGYRVGYASVALICFTLLTIGFVHLDFQNDINFFKNFALIGGLLYVLAYGPGEGWNLGKQMARANAPADNFQENPTPTL